MLRKQSISVEISYPRLILNFLCLLALIIHGFGLRDIKERENQPMLKNFNLNLKTFWPVTCTCALFQIT